jgi:transcriptional regulator with XRE-family HTH domain
MATVPIPRGEFEAALGERFRAARRGRKVRLRDLAAALDVSVNTIRWHENGARMLRSDLLVRAAEHMNIPPSELLANNDAGEKQDGDASNR